MPDGKSFEQLEKEKKEAAEAKAKAEAEKKEPLVLEEDDEFEEFEQEGAPGAQRAAADAPGACEVLCRMWPQRTQLRTHRRCLLAHPCCLARRLDGSGGGCGGHEAVAGRLGR